MKCGECGTYCCANGWEAQAVVLSGHNPACSQFDAKTLTEAAIKLIQGLVVEIDREASMGDGISDEMYPVYCTAKRLLGVNTGAGRRFYEWPDDDNHSIGPNGELLIAVEREKCIKCFYLGRPECDKTSKWCLGECRPDGRTIIWHDISLPL